MTLTKLGDGGFVATGDSVRLVQMVAQKYALKLEVLGMRRHGRSIYSIVKQQYGLTGNKKTVLAKLEALIEEAAQ